MFLLYNSLQLHEPPVLALFFTEWRTPGTVGATITAPEVTSTIIEQGHCSKGTARETVGTTVTAPEETSTINEHTSKVTGQLPIDAPAAPIRMVPLPEVPNGPCLMPDPHHLLPECVSPFPIPGFISPLRLVDADMRTDQRLHLGQIQKPKTLWKKPQNFDLVSDSSCSTSATHIDVLPPIDYCKLRDGLSQVSI